ncbi:MAG: hypothetical protein R6V13_07610 [Anaerolineae bacterium]
MRIERLRTGFLVFAIIALLSGCGQAAVRVPSTPTEQPSEPAMATPTATPTSTLTPTSTFTPAPTSTPTVVETVEQVEGWEGAVYGRPVDGRFDLYFVRSEDGERFVLETRDDTMAQDVKEAAWIGAHIALSGTLYSDVAEGKERRIEVERFEIESIVAPEARYLSPFATVEASSQLEGADPFYAIDDSKETAWGVPGPGVGEWIELTFPGVAEIHEIDFVIGLDKSAEAFAANNRIKEATLIFSSGEQMQLTFEDNRGSQAVSLIQETGSTVKTNAVRMIIDHVYPGAEDGDTYLSEIGVHGVVPVDEDGKPSVSHATPDPALWLPDTAEILDGNRGDLNGDGLAEHIMLVGYGGAPERLGYDALELFVLQPHAEDPVVWHSGHLVGDRAQPLEVEDVNDDGQPEVLSVQSMGASGQTLYILAWRDTDYDFLRPHGGYFDGQDTFGDNSVRLEDLSGDGIMEIRASHGPVASIHEIYRWDGTRYVHERTVEE